MPKVELVPYPLEFIPLEDSLHAIRRELVIRKKVYPRWVGNFERVEGLTVEERAIKKRSPWNQTMISRQEAEYQIGAMQGAERWLIFAKEMSVMLTPEQVETLKRKGYEFEVKKARKEVPRD